MKNEHQKRIEIGSGQRRQRERMEKVVPLPAVPQRRQDQIGRSAMSADSGTTEHHDRRGGPGRHREQLADPPGPEWREPGASTRQARHANHTITPAVTKMAEYSTMYNAPAARPSTAAPASAARFARSTASARQRGSTARSRRRESPPCRETARCSRTASTEDECKREEDRVGKIETGEPARPAGRARHQRKHRHRPRRARG